MIVRRDVVSQAIGFLSLENGVSLTALVVAAGLPLILEVAFLFDLLVAVVVFGLLIRVHHGRVESMSTAELTSLRGSRCPPSCCCSAAGSRRPCSACVPRSRCARTVTAVSGPPASALVLALVASRRPRDTDLPARACGSTR